MRRRIYKILALFVIFPLPTILFCISFWFVSCGSDPEKATTETVDHEYRYKVVTTDGRVIYTGSVSNYEGHIRVDKDCDDNSYDFVIPWHTVMYIEEYSSDERRNLVIPEGYTNCDTWTKYDLPTTYEDFVNDTIVIN